MNRTTDAIEDVLAAWAAFRRSKPPLVPQLTGHMGGVRYNLSVALDELQRSFDEENRVAVLAAELPQRLAELGWSLDSTSKPPWKATKVLANGSTAHRIRHDPEALLEACRSYGV